MKIGLVAPVKPSHPYLENDPAPLLDLHYLRISPWLWFRDTLNKGRLCRSFGSWAGILVCEAFLARTTDGFRNGVWIPAQGLRRT